MGVYIKKLQAKKVEAIFAMLGLHIEDGDIIEVSEPHGGLIDANALCRYALNQTNESVSPNEIMRFPCVIEAEGE